MVHNAEVLRQWFRLTSQDVTLGVAPLFHERDGGPHGGDHGDRLLAALLHRFDAAESLRLIERHRATFTIGSITVFSALLNHPTFTDRDLSSLSKVASGGAPISAAVLQELEAATGVYILERVRVDRDDLPQPHPPWAYGRRSIRRPARSASACQSQGPR